MAEAYVCLVLVVPDEHSRGLAGALRAHGHAGSVAAAAFDSLSPTGAGDHKPPQDAARSELASCRAGPISIDQSARRVTLAGAPLDLTRGEYELLIRLASAPGRVFTKEELLRTIWHQPPDRPTRRLDTLVARLRRRLGDHRAMLVTVWGVGYRLG